MNNKYDVKNFSDLIDNFNLETEVATIRESVTRKLSESRLSNISSQTIFDPLFPDPLEFDKQKLQSRYEFQPCRVNKFDVFNLNK
mmetsp:Transcript_35918/g.55160  ORF Transcript_35918/g.55160 Transcript_35918/m.55160 type:complete len:85 (+) Transcript_35918:756-1010(+)